jgi:hypothetical protein
MINRLLREALIENIVVGTEPVSLLCNPSDNNTHS